MNFPDFPAGHADINKFTPKNTRTGLDRVITVPEKREYLAAQFLGEQPATVPCVLTDALRRSTRSDVN